jgi:hypothetical protein
MLLGLKASFCISFLGFLTKSNQPNNSPYEQVFWSKYFFQAQMMMKN